MSGLRQAVDVRRQKAQRLICAAEVLVIDQTKRTFSDRHKSVVRKLLKLQESRLETVPRVRIPSRPPDPSERCRHPTFSSLRKAGVARSRLNGRLDASRASLARGRWLRHDTTIVWRRRQQPLRSWDRRASGSVQPSLPQGSPIPAHGPELTIRAPSQAVRRTRPRRLAMSAGQGARWMAGQVRQFHCDAGESGSRPTGLARA